MVYIIVLAPLDPVKLVTHIMEGCERARKCSLRFVQRLTPITRAGNGTLNSLAELARDVLPAGFHTEDGRGLKVSATNARQGRPNFTVWHQHAHS